MRMKKRKGGFTLSEMLITVMILIILMGVGVWSYAFFQDSSALKQYDETAETIFSIVQSELTSGRANHSKEEWAERVKGLKTVLNPELLTRDDGNATSYSEIYKDYKGDKKNQIYYLYGDFTDGDSSAAEELLADFLRNCFLPVDYSMVIEGSRICVELDPVEGLVYSVFYSRDSFDSAWSYSDPDQPLANRKKSARRKRLHMVGYFGVHNLSMSTSLLISQPKIEDLVINNEDTLNIQFSVNLDNMFSSAQYLKYDINLFDADNASDIPMMTLHLNGGVNSSEDQQHRLSNLDASTENASVLTMISIDVPDGVNTDSMDLCFPAWIDQNGKVTLVLDAVDFADASEEMQQVYKDLYKELETKTIAQVLQNNSIKDCFSVYRLGLTGKNRIYCTVQGSGQGYTNTTIKTSNRSFCTFDSYEKAESDTEQYRIVNAREFYNIRFEELLSELTTGAEKTYQINEVVDWQNFAQTSRNAYDASKAKSAFGMDASCKDALLSSDSTGKIPFVSFAELRSTSTLEAQNAGEIRNLYISEQRNLDYLKTNSAEDADRFAGTGLFFQNNGTIQNVSLRDITVKGTEVVGAFCAVNAGVLESLSVNGTTPDSSSICGKNYVGGIFGKLDLDRTEAENIQLENLNNQAQILAEHYAGGIVGLLTDVKNSNDQSVEVTIKDCQNTGAILAAVYEPEKNENVGDSDLPEEEVIEPAPYSMEYLSASGINPMTVVADTAVRRFAAAGSSLLSVSYEGIRMLNAPLSHGEKEEFSFFGGIVGMAANPGNSNELITLKNCSSTPLYSDLSRTKIEACMKGNYVGGVLGAGYNVKLINCNTQGTIQGTIIGKNFVGGIAGIFTGSSMVGGDASTNAVNVSVNDANVYGKSYVGGIIGCNSGLEISENDTKTDLSAWIAANGSDWYQTLIAKEIVPKKEKDQNQQVVNWENRGLVVATGNYSGGITGYNTGCVFHCTSNVKKESVSALGSEIQDGDYSGGIVGYNNGIVGNTFRREQQQYVHVVGDENASETLAVLGVVKGHSYIGGVVGYNDVDAVVEDYVVSGGYIEGSGSFVGGYAGVNCSVQLLEQKKLIQSNPNEVKGKYIVGGVIGGNIVTADRPVKAFFSVDNFLASIEAEQAAAGGFIGFNKILSTTVPSDSGAAENYKAELNAIIETESKQLDADAYDAVADGKNKLLRWMDSDFLAAMNYAKTENGSLQIQAKGAAEIEAAAKVKGIKSKICVGGVLGYNAEDTILKVEKISNKIPVNATAFVQAETVEQFKGSNIVENPQLSLAGGILGVVGSRVTIQECRNTDIGDVTSAGTYRGGLCELNLGQIIQCTIASIGDNTSAHIGGICGINYSSIQKTVAENAAIVYGKEYVGAIVSENYGMIEAQNGVFSVNAYGDYSGGIVGYNGALGGFTGNIHIPGDVEVRVSSEGDYAGGLVGENAGGSYTVSKGTDKGKITVGWDEAGKQIQISQDSAVVRGTVSGREYVGGLIGYAKNGTMKGLISEVIVNSEKGHAAGMIGTAESEIHISDCINKGAVNAASGDAAGIVAKNDGTIERCVNAGSIQAPKGNAGGICAENQKNGLVKNCRIGYTDSDRRLQINASKNAGGISALNAGTITGGILYNTAVQNYSNSENSSLVGGIAGENKGRIQLPDNEQVYQNTIVKTEVNGAAVGGIAGSNSGIISEDVSAVASVPITDDFSETYSGKNQEYQFYDCLEATANPSYFDTKVRVTANTKVIYEGCAVSNNVVSLFGVRETDAPKRGFAVYYNQNNSYKAEFLNQAEVASSLPYKEKHVFTLNAATGEFQVDGTVRKTFALDTTKEWLSNSIYVGGALHAAKSELTGTANSGGKVNLYSVQIYEKETLMHNYIPAKRVSDSMIGIYDTVTGEFLRPMSGSYKLVGDIREDVILNTEKLSVAAGSSVAAANIGGIAGKNSGTIEHIQLDTARFDSSIIPLYGGDDFGYGGIAGLNSGIIQNCEFSGTIKVTGDSAAMANLGGIAGRNLTDGIIRESVLGAKAETHIIALGYSNIGGIAGWNDGEISCCDNAAYSNYPVKIDNSRGMTGGIAGVSKEGSLIYGTEDMHLSTGKDWSVFCGYYINDAGTGGIIGFSVSGNRKHPVEYVDNHASVWNAFIGNTNNPVAGLIGRVQNNENSNLTFNYCENDGEVKCGVEANIAGRCGGFFGRLKYMGVTLNHCVNRGNISGYAGGGFISNTLLPNVGQIYLLNDCRNEGNIFGTTYVGGLIGYNGETAIADKVTSQIIDCVNTGLITGNTTSTTNMGGLIGKADIKAYFLRCRNYGNIKCLTNDNLIFSGIARDFSGMTDCFDFREKESSVLSTTVKDISKDNTVINSYYFSGELTQEEQKALLSYENETSVGVKEIKVSFVNQQNEGTWGDSIAPDFEEVDEGKLDNLLDNDPSTSWSIHCKEAPSKNHPILKVTLEDGKTASQMKLSFSPKNPVGEEILEARKAVVQIYIINTNGTKTYLKNNNTIQTSATTWTGLGKTNQNPDEYTLVCDLAKFNSAGVSEVYLEFTDAKYFEGASEKASNTITLRDISFTENNLTSIKAAFAGRSVEYSKKSGFPLSVLKKEDGNLYSSYYVWLTTKDNPLEKIGIPGYQDSTEQLISEEENQQENRYHTLEIPRSIQQTDSLIQKYYDAEYENTTQTLVKNLTLKVKAGAILATWDSLPNIRGYKLCYEVKTKSGAVIQKTLPMLLNNQWRMTIPAEWYEGTIQLFVRGVDGSEEVISSDELLNNDGKEWAQTSSYIGKMLPNPIVYLELGGYFNVDGELRSQESMDQTGYTIILKNTDAYDELLEDGETVTIEVDTYSYGKYQIIYKKGDYKSAYSTTVVNLRANADKVDRLMATALSDVKYSESETVSQQFGYFPISHLRNTYCLKAAFIGFTGTVPSDLTYKITATKNGTIDAYLESEMLAKRKIVTKDAEGEEYTIWLEDVAVAFGNSHYSESDNSIDIMLSDLPEDLLELDDPEENEERSVRVRTYMWKGQNSAWYSGHTVEDAETQKSVFSPEELLQLTDKRRLDDAGNPLPVMEQAEDGEAFRPAAGYTIHQQIDAQGNSTFEVWYSRLLDGTDYSVQVCENKFVYTPTVNNTDNKTIALSSSLTSVTGTVDSKTKNIHRIPVNSNFQIAAENVYQLEWINYATNYQLILYAENSEGKMVVVKDEFVTAQSTDDLGQNCQVNAKENRWQYSFYDADESWNYHSLKVRLISIGTITSGYTSTLPYYTEHSLQLIPRFSSIAIPTLAVPEDTSTMNYKADWSSIPQGEGASGDFQFYEIRIQEQNEDNHSEYLYFLNSSDRMINLIDKLTPNGMRRVDEDSNIFESDRIENITQTLYMRSIIIGKTAYYYLVSDAPISDDTLKELIEKAGEAADLLHADYEQTSAVLSLDNFAGNTVAVSIRAIAIPEYKTYRNGVAGSERILELAARLPMPEIDLLELTPEFDADSSVLQKEIEQKGVEFKIANFGVEEKNGYYEIEIAISEDESGSERKELALTNSYMTGNLEEASYKLPNTLTAKSEETLEVKDLAGKYLIVRMRSKSDNHISSQWTERRAFRITRMQYDIPGMDTSKMHAITYDIFTRETGKSALERSNEKLKANQLMFEITADDLEKEAIRVQLTEKYQDILGDDQMRSYAFEVRQNENQTYEVLWFGDQSRPEFLKAGEYPRYISAESINVLNEMGTVYALPYGFQFANYSVSGFDEIVVGINAWLVIGTDGKISLILPDNYDQNSSLVGIIAHTGLWTWDVSSQSICKDHETYEAYVDSRLSYWYRRNNEGSTTMKETSMDELKKASEGLSRTAYYLTDAFAESEFLGTKLGCHVPEGYTASIRMTVHDAEESKLTQNNPKDKKYYYSMLYEAKNQAVLYLPEIPADCMEDCEIALINRSTGLCGPWISVALGNIEKVAADHSDPLCPWNVEESEETDLDEIDLSSVIQNNSENDELGEDEIILELIKVSE